MNIESLLTGGSGGLLAGLATLFGFNKRLNSHKEALKILGDNKQDKTVCDAKHDLVAKTYSEVLYIRGRLDEHINGGSR